MTKRGPAPAHVPASWRPMIEDDCLHLAAAGQTVPTIHSRRTTLARIARGLQCAPAEVTGEQLVEWCGRQQWKPNTRRLHRSAARGFFAWA
jgi:integrase/recombinase XerC